MIKIPFFFFISNGANPVEPGSEAWLFHLPLSRPAITGGGRDLSPITYGVYFEAISAFLCKDDLAGLIRAVKICFQGDIQTADIKAVRIFLMKHGEFYHPAKIEVDSRKAVFPFVVNTAVSQQGRDLMETEFENLRKMGESFPFNDIPRAFDAGEIKTANGIISLFLGEWFDGFHEFHLSHKAGCAEPGLVVWDDAGGSYFLEKSRIPTVYKEAAALLTSYYDFFSTDHIGRWHHAAGDFILRDDQNSIAVKLITVRQYRPLLPLVNPGLDVLLEALLLFFLNLSIKLRLDRLDGVGDWVMADEHAIIEVIHGFFSGLNRQVGIGRIPGDLLTAVKGYFGAVGREALMELCLELVDRLYRNSPEKDLVDAELEAHVCLLHDRLHRYLPA